MHIPRALGRACPGKQPTGPAFPPESPARAAAASGHSSGVPQSVVGWLFYFASPDYTGQGSLEFGSRILDSWFEYQHWPDDVTW